MSDPQRIQIGDLADHGAVTALDSLKAYVPVSIDAITYKVAATDLVNGAMSELGSAPLDSPAFTGTPSAPTPAPGTNTTQLANTAFVAAALAALINAAPGTLDTLKELADALGDDANFATTMTAALALKAPLASPTFSGTPAAPTPASADNSTTLATTAFVKTAIVSAGGVPRGFIDGCNLSNDGTLPNTKLNMTVGAWADDTATKLFAQSAVAIDCTTTGANGLDAGSLPASGTVHVFAIGKADGTTAGFASTSLTPTLPTGYTYKRRVASWPTDASSHLRVARQKGDEFLLDTFVNTVNGAAFATAASLVVQAALPTGVQVDALIYARADYVTNAANLLLSSPDVSDQAPLNVTASLYVNSTTTVSHGRFNIRTDTSGRIRVRGGATGPTYILTTVGWMDRRGRDA